MCRCTHFLPGVQDGSAGVDARPAAVRLSVRVTREKGTCKHLAVSGMASDTPLTDLLCLEFWTGQSSGIAKDCSPTMSRRPGKHGEVWGVGARSLEGGDGLSRGEKSEMVSAQLNLCGEGMAGEGMACTGAGEKAKMDE